MSEDSRNDHHIRHVIRVYLKTAFKRYIFQSRRRVWRWVSGGWLRSLKGVLVSEKGMGQPPQPPLALQSPSPRQALPRHPLENKKRRGTEDGHPTSQKTIKNQKKFKKNLQWR